MSNFIELTNASTFKLDKLSFNVNCIEGVFKTQKEGIGCILVVNQIKYPVRESYEDVCNALSIEKIQIKVKHNEDK